MAMRFLDTGEGNAAYNMAVDEALLFGVIEGTSPPTLRTYRWIPPAFSIGYSQKMDEQLDPGLCTRHGIDRVRRFTGGRMVLHGWDLTYSIIAAIDDVVPGGRISDAYRKTSVALVASLNLLGARAEYARPEQTDRGARTVKPCFTSVSRFEVSCGGKKIVGSAQRVVGRCFLQHGSLPLSAPPVGSHYFIPRISDAEREALGIELERRAARLSSVLGRRVEYSEARDAIVRGFGSIFSCGIEMGELSEIERGMISKLEEGKYGKSSWNDHGENAHMKMLDRKS